MIEQRGKHVYIPQRASLSPDRQTARGQAQQYPHSPQQYRTHHPPNSHTPDELEEDEFYYPVRSSSSAIRYTTSQDQVIQQGNKRIIIHHEPPLTRKQQGQPEPAKHRKHWLFWLGCIFCIMLIGWTVLSMLSGFLQHKRDDLLYGTPRTFQTDVNVGHYGRVSHFVAINLDGYIEIFETQRTHPEAAKIYTPTALQINPQDPVTLTFQDVNGDGKLDMIIATLSFQTVLFNTGTSFQSQPPAAGH